MGTKGHQTRELIKSRAYLLFAEKGFSAVTMKDICEACGLSRGGLYRHYESTQQVLEDILEGTSQADTETVCESMDRGVSAWGILDDILERMRLEMVDAGHSLSFALYEYSCMCDSGFMEVQNRKAREKWGSLIDYGIQRKEFAAVNVEQMTDMILYTYQGVRMWSRMMPIKQKTAQNIVDKIRTDLERKEL